MFLDLPRQLQLQTTHFALDDSLDLVGQIRLDVLLQSSEEERSKDLVETSNDEERFFFVDLDLVLSACVCERSVEPLVERFDGTENLGQYEIEERPQLGEVVLRSRVRSGQSRHTLVASDVRGTNL